MILEIAVGLFLTGGFAEGLLRHRNPGREVPPAEQVRQREAARVRPRRATLENYGTERAPDRALLREADREAQLVAEEERERYDPATAPIPF